jgi:acyl-homoserine lactone synthase
MFRLESGHIDHDDQQLADRIYKFRHSYFVEHLGWEACRKLDHRERDQFDGLDTFHVVGEERDEIVAYARLLPTTRPHLLSDLYPEIMQGAKAPTGRRIYEWTRQSVVPKRREFADGNTFSNAFMGAVAQVADVLDLEGLLVQTHPTLVGRLIETGWDVEPLALPTTYAGAILVSVYARLTTQTLEVAQAAFAALPGARLDLPSDLHFRSPTDRPEYAAQ